MVPFRDLSVCLFVTFVHCAQTAEDIDTISYAYDSRMSLSDRVKIRMLTPLTPTTSPFPKWGVSNAPRRTNFATRAVTWRICDMLHFAKLHWPLFLLLFYKACKLNCERDLSRSYYMILIVMFNMADRRPILSVTTINDTF